VRLLLDSHILLWAAQEPHQLSEARRIALDDRASELYFSVVSLWELGIKVVTSRGAFSVDLPLLRRRLIARGYKELPVTGEHALRNMLLPLLHRDPFDRILIAQAQVEGLPLVTDDSIIRQYPGVRIALDN
jgi:PIN domain nuclease of toxin-antitoxin system